MSERNDDWKVSDYGVIGENFSSELAASVVEAMKDGWEPYGPPFYVDRQGVFCQAMVKWERRTP